MATSIGRQTNVDSILVLEKRIQEKTVVFIQLKPFSRSFIGQLHADSGNPRLRLSFERHARGPPPLSRIMNGLVQFPPHIWFELVACRAPMLWSVWSNNLGDWTKRNRRPKTSPLNLVLGGVEHRVPLYSVP